MIHIFSILAVFASFPLAFCLSYIFFLKNPASITTLEFVANALLVGLVIATGAAILLMHLLLEINVSKNVESTCLMMMCVLMLSLIGTMLGTCGARNTIYYEPQKTLERNQENLKCEMDVWL